MTSLHNWYPKLTILLLFTFFLGIAQAQVVDEYPTVTALEEANIPARDRFRLARELLGLMPDNAPIITNYEVGDRKMFGVVNQEANRTFDIEAELTARGDHIYIWVDTSGTVDETSARHLASRFDSNIYGKVRALWGSEASPGVDGDPRIHVLFATDIGETVLGYFSSEHSLPPSVVPSSNGHEMFFFNLDFVGQEIDVAFVEATLAHEFQHMIRYNIKSNSASWVNEGYSMFTELYMGYPDTEYYIYDYTNEPQIQLTSWGTTVSETFANYGASMLFITYIYEQLGYNVLRQISDAPETDIRAIDRIFREQGIEEGFDGFFADWLIANRFDAEGVTDERYFYEMVDVPEFASVKSDKYPFSYRGIANPYSANYFELLNLPESGKISISVDMDETAQLIPQDAASGDFFWYSNRADESLMLLTRAFDLRGIANPTLQYKVWYDLEPLWDYGYVMISADNGESWDILTTPYTTDENPHNNAYGQGYTGVSTGWLDEKLSLRDYVDQEILVRFAVITDDATNHFGMAIDDVRIGDFSDDFETVDESWEAEGWVRIDNVLPQRAWVQVVQNDGGKLQIDRFLWEADTTYEIDLMPGANVERTLILSPVVPVTTLTTDFELNIEVVSGD